MSSPRNLIDKFVGNPVLANLLAAGILVGGILAVRNLPREVFPETAINYVVVSVSYPGASPADVEEGICIKIEEAIKGIPGLWEIVSLSDHNLGRVFGAVDPAVMPTPEVVRAVQDRVNAIASFPPEALKPIVFRGVVRIPVISIGVYGDAPERTIKRVAEEIRNDLAAHPSVSQVSVSGVRDYEMSVKVKEETLKEFGSLLQQNLDVISQSTLDLPSGTVRAQHEEINVRTLGQRYSASDFEDIVVIARPDGATVQLGQIARVRDDFEEVPVFGRMDGKRAALIRIFKTGPEDISAIAKIVRDYVQSTQAALPDGVEIAVWADESHDVDARISMLIKNGLFGMVLVLVCLLLFLDSSSAAAVAIGIPVSFAGAFIALSWTGGTINMISLLGILMATGIIVDDAIVIAESVRTQRQQGLSPKLAASAGTLRVAAPVLMASLTTIVTFGPLVYVEGEMGTLIHILPVVVIAAIVTSAVEAFVILPAHLCEWAGLARSTVGAASRLNIRQRIDTWLDRFIRFSYGPLLRKALAHRAAVLAGTAALALICVGLVRGGRTPFVLFPAQDTNLVLARVRFPDGAPISASEDAVARMERAANAMNDDPALEPDADGPLISRIYSAVGEWSEFVPKKGSALCETWIELMPAEDRKVDVGKVIDNWRARIGDIPGVLSMRIERQQLGPVSKPIEIRLLGHSLEELRSAADAVTDKLRTYDNVFDIEDELTPGKRTLHVTLKPSARNLGLTVGELASQLRQGLQGGEAVRLQRGIDEVKAVVSYADSHRKSLSAIENLRIRTSSGAQVPFREVADTKLVRGFASITRQDGKRRCSVHADIDERFTNAEQIVADLEATFLPDLQERFPGVTYVVAGERQQINETMGSLVRGACVAAVVMFALLGTTLRSYLQPIVIMVAIPLGMIGAILGHAILQLELTLMSAFGIVALAGIVVNDSLVLLDRVNRNLSAGMNVIDAAADAGQARFRAVILTTMTTVAGLLPLLAERSSQAQPLIPLAVSIAFGELFGTILTLIVVPAMFVVTNDAKRFAHWLRHGGPYPPSELVERNRNEEP